MPSIQSTNRLQFRPSTKLAKESTNPLPPTYQIHNITYTKTTYLSLNLNFTFLLSTSHSSTQINLQRYYFDPMTGEILIETIFTSKEP